MLEILGQTDIYLLDQFMRGRLSRGMTVLDAGCGYGRNSMLPIGLGCHVHGIDINPEAIAFIAKTGPTWGSVFEKANFITGDLTSLPFEDRSFDFIICSAVLHFAHNRDHFTRMFRELARVLNSGGIFWFRMTTKHTLEHLAKPLAEDIYEIPDGSVRYLLDRTYLEELMEDLGLFYADPFKTVNVADVRAMCVAALTRTDKE